MFISQKSLFIANFPGLSTTEHQFTDRSNPDETHKTNL
jgi:hypothetical protein